MTDRISVAVLFGGVSSEHEISCISAASVLNHIDRDRYDISTIGITKEGNWFLTGSPVANIGDGSWEKDDSNRRAFIAPDRSVGGIMAETGDGRFEICLLYTSWPIISRRSPRYRR